MTVDSCRYDHQGRGQTTVCEGHGDPAGSGMTAGRWEIPSADHFYDAGAVVSVRCSGADDCVEPGVHAIANDAVGILLGVGFTAGGVLCAFAGLAERLPSERLDPFSTRRRKLAVFGFGALGVLMASLTAVWAVT
ncbi:hypothetical protein [Kitasatospora sp. NPDC047058]|uniref:hypothetical protein n=1 Tax=Kitasatospora sp. NPDC047058 TaxID=3155620 RepID=UPI0033C7C213